MPANLNRPYGDRFEDALPAILSAIAAGSTIKRACLVAGFSDRSFREYRKAHPDVDLAVEQAEAKRDALPADQLYKKAKRDPFWAKVWLEKRQPEEWAPDTKRIELANPDGESFRLEGMSPAQMRAEIARIAAEYASATPTSGAPSETVTEAEKIGRDPSV